MLIQLLYYSVLFSLKKLFKRFSSRASNILSVSQLQIEVFITFAID